MAKTNSMAGTSSATLMTSGPIWKRLVAFAIPLFWGNLFQQLYNTADSVIVGNFLGNNALAAVSSSGNLIFLLVGFFNGIAIGAGVVTGKYFGAGDNENLKKSIFNGFVAYLIVACSFFAILYYGTLAQTDIVYGSVFTIYIVFSIAMLIMLFYVPLLTITYDLRLRDIYKNSLLLIFGKILRNIVALVLVVIVSFAVFLAVIYAKGAMLVVAVALSVIFYPMIATYIVVSVIAKGVQESVGYFTGDNVQYVLTEEEVQRETEAVENANSDDDYVFVNGRMIKNSG